jgi:DNA repair exonuclease SbcCD nuclease subunit
MREGSMKRFALISDQHFDASSRFDDCLRICDWICKDLRARQVDGIGLGGDLFERRPVPIESKAAAEWIVGLAELAPVVGVYGNHDVVDSLAVMNRLDTKHPVHFYDAPAVHRIGDIGIACLPWPRRGALLASLGGNVGHETANQVAAQHLCNILRGLGAELDAFGTKLLLGHVQLRGARISLDQPLAPGADFELGTEDLGLARAHAYLLGHVHLQQEVTIAGAPCFYPGAPRRCNFGESATKHYAIVSIEHGHASVEYVQTPATPMLLLTGEWRDGALAWQSSENCEGAEVRLRYGVDADQREGAKAAAQKAAAFLSDNGAVSVKIEEVVRATTRARTPEIATAVSIADKLRVLWKAKGIGFSNDRERRLLARLAELEAA